MKLQTSDYFLVRCSRWGMPFFRWLGNRETALLRPELSAIEIKQPVFITGLARAGTTMLLELLSTLNGFASHRYRDFPFLMVPYFWNNVVDKTPAPRQPVERAHRDRIMITRESPEAFEEPIWQAFFPHVHSATDLHRLDDRTSHPRFESFFRDHMRKMLLIRKGNRYLSKGNYNVSRIEYIARLFPDARFLVVIRHPFTHVHSLVRQHNLTCGYAAQDARVPKYLAVAGHYEFGPQRIPIQLDLQGAARIRQAWLEGDEYLGYAIQWAEIYRFVNSLRESSPPLQDRIHVVRYEDLCANPSASVSAILRHIHVDAGSATSLLSSLERISLSDHQPRTEDVSRTEIIDEVALVARRFGYDNLNMTNLNNLPGSNSTIP